MPIYEYVCLDCRRKVSLFYRTISQAEQAEPRCPRCNGVHLRRVISKVRMLRSAESRLEDLEDLDDPATLAGLEDDPRALGRMMRQMSEELGDEIDDPEFHEVIDRLEAGQSPEEIEQALPDLGNEGGDMADF